MKRETLRQTIITISAVLMPFLLVFISPVVALMAAADGTIATCTIVFVLLYLLAMFLGRLWCGWLCPCGGMQDLIGMFSKKKTQENRTLLKVKATISISWILAIVILYVLAGGIPSINPYYSVENGIGGLFPGMVYASLFIIAIFVILTAIFGVRAFCRHLCPVGFLLIFGRAAGRDHRIPQLGVTFYPKKCVHCGNCIRSCPMGIKVVMPKIYYTDSPNCINCGVCCEECKTGALKHEICRDWDVKK